MSIQISKSTKWIALFVLFLLLVPYFWASLYAFPAADDYCWSWDVVKHQLPLYKFLLYSYRDVHSRMTSDVFLYFAPLNVHSLVGYRLAPIILMLLFLGSLFFFFQKLFRLQYLSTALMAMLFACGTFALFPCLAEAFYWYTGAWTYTLGTILFFPFLWSLMHFSTNKKLSRAVLVIVAFSFCSTCSELHLMLCTGTLVLTLLYHLYAQTVHLYWFLVAGILLVFVLMLVVAPGNFHRNSMFSQQRDVYAIVYRSTVNSIDFARSWMFDPFALVMAFGIVLFGEQLKIKVIPIVFTLLFLAMLLFISVFVPTYIQGIIGQLRTVNAVTPVFLLGYFYLLLCLRNNYLQNFALQFRASGVLWFVLVVVAIVYTKNTKVLYSELADGTIVNCYAEQMIQQGKIMQSNAPNLEDVPTLSKRSIIVNYDIKPGEKNFVNNCPRIYLNNMGLLK